MAGEETWVVSPPQSQSPARDRYTSPPRKLVRVFAQSRDRWKAKCQAAKKTIKRQQNRLRFLETSREQWKHKARQRADDNRYLHKELARIKQERDRDKQALKAAQVRLRLSDSYPDEKLLYLMIIDPSQPQTVRERETAEITVAMEAWEQAFSAESPENILSLYAEDSVLWGTLSRLRWDTPAAIQGYFTEVFISIERKVTFTDPLIRVYGDIAVNTGSYTFSWVREGKTETIPSRYSITYVKRYQRWLIVDHHSSVIPEPRLKRSSSKESMINVAHALVKPQFGR